MAQADGQLTIDWAVFKNDDLWVIHRGPMTEEAARQWVAEWESMVRPDAKMLRKGMFLVGRREVGPWSRA